MDFDFQFGLGLRLRLDKWFLDLYYKDYKATKFMYQQCKVFLIKPDISSLKLMVYQEFYVEAWRQYRVSSINSSRIMHQGGEDGLWKILETHYLPAEVTNL